MRLIFLIFLIFLLFPMASQAAQFNLTWNENPASENVEGYKVFINDTIVNTKLTAYQFEGAEGDCLSVSAVNLMGESPKTDQLCLPSLPSTPSNIRVININIVVQ